MHRTTSAASERDCSGKDDNGANSKSKHEAMWQMQGGLSMLNAASADDQESSMHQSFRTEATGVSGLTMHSAFGSIPIQPGEYVSDPFERPLSAPPPPGFGVGPEERTRKASEMMLRLKQDDNDSGERHSNSFSNLAAVLGTGLAQSMEDATHERFLPEFDDKDALNFHRQSRHAASRLLGTTGDPLKPAKRHAPDAYGSGMPSNNDVLRGFPSSLSAPASSPESKRTAEARDSGRRTSTPVHLYPGHSLPSKDIGTHVSEPDSELVNQFRDMNIISQRLDDPMSNLHHQQQQQQQTVLSSTAREFRPQPQLDIPDSNASTDSDNNSSEISSRHAEIELKPFTWDVDQGTSSRTLVILHVSFLRVPDVRSSCETFGLLEGFRADFSSRGIYFVSYYDIRSAQYAARELQAILQRLSIMQRSNEEVVIKFCLPLNSSSQFDDSQIVISELPPEINEYTLRSMLSSYGSIRSISQQTVGAYVVEFNNIQDAKQSQLELDSTQPFGPSIFVEMAMRSSAMRKKGRELLALIGRWRQGFNRAQTQTQAPPPVAQVNRYQAPAPDPWRNLTQQTSVASSLMNAPTEVVGMGAAYGGTGLTHHLQQLHHQETTQLVLGPDGRYTPVLVHSQIPFSSFAPPGATAIDPRQQQIIQGPNGQIYLAPVSAAQSSMYGQQQHISLRTQGTGLPVSIATSGFPQQNRNQAQTRTPYYSHVVADSGSLSGRSLRSAYSTGTEGDKDTRHLLLDLDAVESGRDTRTSLMVRNIPNKYTQQMLLAEFEENGHGPGVIDFFYLPIDFKNRCNRGYAFINFVEFRDIVPFHHRYFGKHWRTFNSDKICDITYARIQGKAAMLKRFENSALMEKDDEYKPLVFASNGPHKGMRLPFPDLDTATTSTKNLPSC